MLRVEKRAGWMVQQCRLFKSESEKPEAVGVSELWIQGERSNEMSARERQRTYARIVPERRIPTDLVSHWNRF